MLPDAKHKVFDFPRTLILIPQESKYGCTLQVNDPTLASPTPLVTVTAGSFDAKKNVL